MKKRQKILCAIFAVLIFAVAIIVCVCLVKCSPNKPSGDGNNNDNKPKQQTISITEAKQYLADALKVEGKEDVYVVEKFGTFHVKSVYILNDSATDDVADFWIQLDDDNNIVQFIFAAKSAYSSTVWYIANDGYMYDRTITIDAQGNEQTSYKKWAYSTEYFWDSYLFENTLLLQQGRPVLASGRLDSLYTDGTITKTSYSDGRFDVKVELDASNNPIVNASNDVLEVTYSYDKTGNLIKLEYLDGGYKDIVEPCNSFIVAPEWVNDTNFPPEQN